MNLLLRYSSLLCLIVIAFYPEYAEHAASILAGLLLVFATSFYFLMTSSIIGIREIRLSDDIDINYTWQNRAILATSLVALMMSGMPGVVYYILPFALIGLVTDVFATLLVMGAIEVEDSDPEDDE